LGSALEARQGSRSPRRRGLGGRQFGTWVTWFLLGSDFYTAYTVIAVPALVFAVGGYGFFAPPYTIIVYPIVFLIMPKLRAVAQKRGHVTAADVVHERYGSRGLELAVALTGVLATMPYIALELVALYTYSSGLRAPALIAFVKDTMIYIVVLVAIVYIRRTCSGGRDVDRRSQPLHTKILEGLCQSFHNPCW
jgi:SSS family solute:Na+ symporter